MIPRTNWKNMNIVKFGEHDMIIKQSPVKQQTETLKFRNPKCLENQATIGLAEAAPKQQIEIARPIKKLRSQIKSKVVETVSYVSVY